MPASQWPSITAVTLNFGAPDDTLECVRSLIATGYPSLRIIVVDNGSATEHRTRLTRDLPAGVEIIQSEENLGFAGGNNLGIQRALASGTDLVLLINNDAVLERDALRILTRTAERIPRLGVLGCKILVAGNGATPRIWSAGGTWSPLRASGFPTGIHEPDRGQFDREGERDFLAACLWVIPVAVLREAGLLDEEFFLYAEDLDYCLRLREKGYQVYYEPKAICIHKVSGSHWDDRDRASPTLNYYTNRNRMLIARRWLNPLQKLVFVPYLLLSRLVLAVTRWDRTYLWGIWDGLRGRTGPWRRTREAERGLPSEGPAQAASR